MSGRLDVDFDLKMHPILCLTTMSPTLCKEGVAGFIQIQNDARGRSAEFSRSRTYWNSRLRVLGRSALYGTQFELGAISEAAIGNVGKRKGTASYYVVFTYRVKPAHISEWDATGLSTNY
jgi:hypothetical protein